MPTPPLSDELALEAYHAWVAAGHNDTKAAGQVGMNPNTFRSRRLIGERLVQIPQGGIEKIRATGAPLQNATAAWFKDDNVSVLCRFDSEPGAEQSFLDRCKDALSGVPAVRKVATPRGTEKDLMTVYPIVDHHLAMHAWEKETGENYDLSIGRDRLIASAERLMATTPSSEVAEIVNLGDFFHQDDSRNETPASKHQLDVDGRYFKVIDTGVEVTAAVIDHALRKHGKVRYRAIRGNHDPHAHVALTVGLMQRYRNEPRVEVVASDNDFHLIRWGKCLALCHHGDKARAERLVMFMSDHYAKQWGETFWRFLWTGHIHHDSAKDIGGVHWESFRTLAPKDAYAHSHGYSSRQTMNAITLHKDEGEVIRNKVNITPPWAS